MIKLERLAEAKTVFEQAKSKGAKAGEGFDQLEKRLASSPSTTSNTQEPSQQTFNKASHLLINLYNQNNIIGSKSVFRRSSNTNSKAISIEAWFSEFNNMGITLKKQGKLDEAIEGFQKSDLNSKPIMLMPITTWAMHYKSKTS